MSFITSFRIDATSPPDVAVRYEVDATKGQWLVDLIYVRGCFRWVAPHSADRFAFPLDHGMAVMFWPNTSGNEIAIYTQRPDGLIGAQDRHVARSGRAWAEYFVPTGSEARPVLVEKLSPFGAALEALPVQPVPHCHRPSAELCHIVSSGEWHLAKMFDEALRAARAKEGTHGHC